ncbi:MAG: hypothetical protein D6752_02235 [Candidatus Nitrosothermus koennekii]|nr:MAG: hypothetical protein D6752_02235 [Candidatus Nitrosothermus koennekii]
MDKDWLRRRWFEFRQGHSIYLVFIMSFSNFILINYRLLIERVPSLQAIFSELWIFVLFFIVIYIPAAILIGHWHRTTQLRVDTTMTITSNPMMAKFFRILIDMQLGKASKEEIEEVRRLLKSIENKYFKDED